MNIFILNDQSVKTVRNTHSALKGKKLIARGQFSGVYESGNSDTVLKLSIDAMGYESLFGPYSLSRESNHFTRPIRDFGKVGEFIVGKNISKTAITQPKTMPVPMYLYEIERLHKLPVKGPNRSLVNRICKKLRILNGCSFIDDRHERNITCLMDLAFDDHLKDHPSLSMSFLTMAKFLKQNSDAFPDLHTGNFMQRQDGTLVISDPVGSTSIYECCNTFKPVSYDAPLKNEELNCA
nr:hypothetical protein [Acinetobacter baumannii]